MTKEFCGEMANRIMAAAKAARAAAPISDALPTGGALSADEVASLAEGGDA